MVSPERRTFVKLRRLLTCAALFTLALVGASAHLDAGLAARTSAAAVPPKLAIDADPGNGTRPCAPVDATRQNGPTSGTYSVAICLVNGAGSPDSFEARVLWSGSGATAPEVADSGDALSDNPDFNDSAAPNGFGTNWSCTGFGTTFPVANQPETISVNDAHIVCNEKNLMAGTMTNEPGLLATLTMTATGASRETFAFSTNGTSSVNSPAGENFACGFSTQCSDGLVIQGPDADGDTYPDALDDCPNVSDPSQTNTDAINTSLGLLGTDALGDACDPDDDGDGCTDTQEGGVDPALGGVRNSLNPWDFYDVSNPQDRKVNAVDVALVKSRFGTVQGGQNYIAAYDRSGGPHPWAPASADGVINGLDVALAKASFGDSCS